MPLGHRLKLDPTDVNCDIDIVESCERQRGVNR